MEQSMILLCSNPENCIRGYDGISEVVSDILKNGALLAIVSNKTSKAINVGFSEKKKVRISHVEFLPHAFPGMTGHCRTLSQ